MGYRDDMGVGDILRISRINWDCGVCGKRADFSVNTKTKHGSRVDHYCACHLPEGVAEQWRKEFL